MKVLIPYEVTDSNLISCSVPETETGLAVWSAATTYAAGQRCFMTTGVHKIFESVAAGNLNHNPSSTTGYWIEISPTNRWKMFDRRVGTVTEYTSNIQVVFQPTSDQYVNGIAILDSLGTDVLIEVLDATTSAILYSSSFLLYTWDNNVSPDWYWYFFTPTYPVEVVIAQGIPSFYNSKIRVTVNYATGAKVGTIAFGTLVDIGKTQFNPKLGIIDYSKKETDEFGYVDVIERRFTKTLSCDVEIPNVQLTQVFKLLSTVRATPVVWVGSDEALFDSTILYGFYKNFDIVIEGPTHSMCSLEIESLT